MTKEDYMKLTKERLAELLAERDAQDTRTVLPPMSVPPYAPDCFHGGPCTNPFHDCVNCPHLDGGDKGVWTTHTSIK